MQYIPKDPADNKPALGWRQVIIWANHGVV